jgi:two-component system response regulator AtoC
MNMGASPSRTVLVADDEPNLRKVLAAQLERDGYTVVTVENGELALHAMQQREIDVLVADLRMPHMDGMQLLRHVTTSHPNLPVIVITAHGTVDTAVEALKLGAFDYVTKPFDRAEFQRVVEKAMKTRELSSHDVTLSSSDPGRYRLIGQSTPMQQVYQMLEKVADTPSTVLITGESGTGKELIARALHDHSARASKPFVRVNCAAIPSELIESELFGYERGAFTGAVTSKPGRFELAHGGTLFLDEIGEIPISMQVKLLRAIQESEFERVGGIKTITVDVRLVTATNQDLQRAIKAGAFREDLYYRLQVIELHLPALRERVSDIPLLVEHFLHRFRDRLKKNVTEVRPEAMRALMQYHWPGNIRELENVIERCVLFAEGATIRLEDLPTSIQQVAVAASASPIAASAWQAAAEPEAGQLDTGHATAPQEPGLKDAVREMTAQLERQLITLALEATKGNVTRAAQRLKISRKSLQLKMKEFGLRVREES